MLDALARTLTQIFSRPFRRILWQSLGMTLLLLATLGAGGFWATGFVPDVGIPWLDAVIDVLLDGAVVIALFFLVVPVTALIVPLFQDEVAEVVEARDYPAARGTRSPGLFESLAMLGRSLARLAAFNLVALPLALLLPGAGFLVFLGVNGYLLALDFFEAVAARHMPRAQAAALRARNKGRLVLAGLVIAGLLAVPVVNVLVPLFGMAFMVHVFHRLTGPADAGPRARAAAKAGTTARTQGEGDA